MSEQSLKTAIEEQIQGKAPEDVLELVLDTLPVKKDDFAELEPYTELKSLTLNSCGLTSLEGFPAMPKLVRLELSDNLISEGLECLQDSSLVLLRSLCHHLLLKLRSVLVPLLIVAAATGTLMIFPAVSAFLLSPFGEAHQKPALSTELAPVGPATDWQSVMRNAQGAFPSAAPRRLMLPSKPGEPIAIRFRQDFEWTPNGRSYVWIAPDSAAVVGTDDPAKAGAVSAISETFYPIHAAKVGGIVWRLAMTFAGLALHIMLASPLTLDV
mgnify:CR=1 FL=1